MARNLTPDLIDQTFPQVHWTGRSDIHRSWYRQASMGFGGPRYHSRIMKAIEHSKFGHYVYDMLQEQFTGCEWLMDEQEFHQLLMVDMYRSLKGLDPSESNQKLKNPRTGNVFHRLALKNGSVVGGIRFWCNSFGPGAPEDNEDGHKDYNGETSVGFRFRVELINEDEGTVRAKARLKVAEAVSQYQPIMEELMIGEPDDQEKESARKTMRIVAEDDGE